MSQTQNARTLSRSSRSIRVWLLAGMGLIFTAGCGGAQSARSQANDNNPVLQAHLQRTVLEAHTPTAVPVEARLALGADGAQSLTGQEYSQLTAFANDFLQLGRGALVISIPANSGNSTTAALIAQDAQRALYAGGVDFARISGGTYDAQGRPNAPVLLSFARYEAVKIACQPWSEIDPRKTATNLSPARFGCAQNANLAAMVADPGDLLADRKDGPRDAGRIQVGVDKQRKGEVSTVSSSVAGGGQ